MKIILIIKIEIKRNVIYEKEKWMNETNILGKNENPNVVITAKIHQVFVYYLNADMIKN